MEEPDVMPWVRLDDALLTDPRFVALDADEKAGYIAVLLLGASTDPPGSWPTRDVLEASLPRWVPPSTVGACVRFLLLDDPGVRSHGIEVPPQDAALYRPLTAAERQAGWRRRRRNADVDERVDADVDEPSLSFSSTSTDDATSREGAREVPEGWWDIARHVEDLTGQAYALGDPSGRMGDRVVRMLAKHGPDRLTDAMTRAATAAGAMPTTAQVVLGAGNILDAIPRAERGDCETCYRTGVTAKGRSPCPDCGRRELDADLIGNRGH